MAFEYDCGVCLRMMKWLTHQQTDAMKLKNLATLVIGSWPTFDPGFKGPVKKAKNNLWIYQRHLQAFAHCVFVSSDLAAAKTNTGRRSRLQVVAWGGTGKSKVDEEDDYKLRQMVFIRGQTTDALNREEFTVVKRTKAVIKFLEPSSDILDYPLCAACSVSLSYSLISWLHVRQAE